jgi:hypothetical protein
MILMVVCSVGTQFDLHAYMVSTRSEGIVRMAENR